MSKKITYNIDLIREKLENVEVNLREVKLVCVDFGLEGNSSGLNAFIYSYVKLANLLVEYRRFARNDISEVCKTVDACIKADDTTAKCINDNSIPVFREFSINIDNTNDTAGSQEVPSIITPSFRVSRQDAENMTSKFSSSMIALSAKLIDLKTAIEDFTKNSGSEGEAADAMMSYWKEVHIPILKAFDTALWTLYGYMMSYGPDLITCVNDDLYFVLTQSEMEASITELRTIQTSLESIVNDVDSKVTSYSSLLGINVTIPNGGPMLYKYQLEANKIQALIDRVISFESSKVTLVTNYVDGFVANMTKLITTVDERVGTIGIKKYTNGLFDKICEANGIEPIIDVDACKRQEEDLIKAFEAANPKYAEAMNNFLDNDDDMFNDLSDDMKTKIKYTAYTAPEPFRTVIMNEIMNGKVSIGILCTQLFFGLRSNDNFIFNTVNFSKYDRNNISTFWHEMGHSADDIGSLYWGSVSKYKTYNEAMGKEVTFADALNYDIYDNPNNPHSIRCMANQYIRDMRNRGAFFHGDVDNVIKAFKSGDGQYALNEDEQKMYRDIAKRFMNGRQDYMDRSSYNDYDDKKAFSGVTDVYGGMTHNGIVSTYNDTTGERTSVDDWTHEDWYWNKPTWIAQTEFYAEYFSANVSGNEQEIARMREYFPEATKVADSYTKDLAGN